jgi:hypothetical protein
VVDHPPVTQHAEEDGLQETAVGGREFATLGVPFYQSFGIVMALGPGTERGDGGLADVEILGWHGSGKKVTAIT